MPWKGLEIRPAEFLEPDNSDSGARMLSPVAVWPLSLLGLPSTLDLEANNDAMVLAIACGPNAYARLLVRRQQKVGKCDGLAMHACSSSLMLSVNERLHLRRCSGVKLRTVSSLITSHCA
jgi:hypothetical protein